MRGNHKKPILSVCITQGKRDRVLIESVDKLVPQKSLLQKLALPGALMAAILAFGFRDELNDLINSQRNPEEIPLNERIDAYPGEEIGWEIDDGSAYPQITEKEAEVRFEDEAHSSKTAFSASNSSLRAQTGE
ncbi:MAG: hypothetical protein Q8P68_05250 [Candidatus Peregrinibacteria bacterium]|nr:hypothetical protein [Candidatus Peregrinibacteria bacterium]MDZ4244401.1 hypothetical protein [Candidatus Gracilibacteria bacterium]